MKLSSFDAILGVDQTGAIKPSGTPKPLPAVLIYKAAEIWEFFCEVEKAPLCLKAFQWPEFERALSHVDLDLKMSRVLVVVDSVLGLPRAFETSLEPSEQIRHFMTKAAEHKGYGARSSEAFFSLVLQSLSPQKAGASEARFPRREVETSLGANSVFQARPYQRNIQTGTYRIWKDLATPTQENGLRTLDLVSLWPFDSSVRPKKGLPIVAEGYPSLAWKILNRSHRGRPLRLDSSLTKGISGLARFSSLPADHQDAAFLALLAWDLLSKDQFHKPAEIHLEGDILGSVKT